MSRRRRRRRRCRRGPALAAASWPSFCREVGQVDVEAPLQGSRRVRQPLRQFRDLRPHLAADEPGRERQHGQDRPAAGDQRRPVRQAEPVPEGARRGEEQHRDDHRAEEQQQGAAHRPEQQRQHDHGGDDEDAAEKGRLGRQMAGGGGIGGGAAGSSGVRRRRSPGSRVAIPIRRGVGRAARDPARCVRMVVRRRARSVTSDWHPRERRRAAHPRKDG